MSATMREPDDVRLWRDCQRSGVPTPWSELGIRFLEDGEMPEMIDTSSLTDEDLADPDIRANVQAMAETNALITWVAEDDGERAYGCWSGPEELTDSDDSRVAVIVSLDSEGQYMMVPGRTLTEALCVECSDYDDEAFAVLAARVRDVALQADPHFTGALIDVETIAELPTPALTGPGAFRHSRYTALRATATDDDAGESPLSESTTEEALDPHLLELPEDLVRWRAHAAAGDPTPWDRFGIRFLDDGELPSEVTRAEAWAAETGTEYDRLGAEATRLTAERATWVVENGDGRSLGYWHGADGTPIGAAPVILLEPSEWFGHVPGRTLTEAMCVDFGEYEDALISSLAQDCRALGFDVQGDALADFPLSEAQEPRSFRYQRKVELEERARQARTEAADVAAAAAKELSLSAPQSAAVITGELPTVIAALGQAVDGPEAQAAFALFGPPFQRSNYAIDSVTSAYYVAAGKHAELIADDGVLMNARVVITDGEKGAAYARPNALIDGIGPETTREQILERFGTPEWSNDHADRFWITADAPGRVFVRFEYGDGLVEEITVAYEAPDL